VIRKNKIQGDSTLAENLAHFDDEEYLSDDLDLEKIAETKTADQIKQDKE